MQNAVQKGDTLIYTATANIKGGDLVVMEDFVGVAYTDIASGAEGTLDMVGVFEIPKGTGPAIAQGQRVYIDASDNLVITAQTGEVDNTPVGIAWESALAADAVVTIKINV